MLALTFTLLDVQCEPPPSREDFYLPNSYAMSAKSKRGHVRENFKANKVGPSSDFFMMR